MWRYEYVCRLQKPRACALFGPADVDYLPLQAVLHDHIQDRRLQITVSDQEEAHFGSLSTDLGKRRSEYVDPMPPAKRSDEADDRRAVRKAERSADRAAFLGFRRRILVAVDSVWIGQDLRRA